MKGINWAELYNLYHTITFDTNKLETRIAELYLDDENSYYKSQILSG